MDFSRLKLFISFIALLSGSLLSAQNSSVKLTVVDERGQAVIGAAVTLMDPQDESKRIGARATDVTGLFEWKGINQSRLKVQVQYIGYRILNANLELEAGKVLVKTLQLTPDNQMLDETQVIGQLRAEELRGDTSVIKADAFTTHTDANAGELLDKMPGLNVRNGTVEAQGESVGLVLVDGKPFFGENSKAALDVLPAGMIDEVKVYDRQSDQSRFTGFKDGNTTKTIDIITKKDKKFSSFGEAKAFYGTDDRYELGGNLNLFRGSERVSVMANLNNINVLGFDAQNAGGPSFRGAIAPPIPSGQIELNEWGVNYNRSWTEVLDVQASYRFSDRTTLSGSDVRRVYVLPEDSGQVYTENTLSVDDRLQHRLNLDLVWTPDSNNRLEFSPSLSATETSSNSKTRSNTVNAFGTELNSVDRNSISNGTSWALSGEALYGRRFSKKGRTASLGVLANAQGSESDGTLYSINSFEGEGDTLDQTFQTQYDDPAWRLNLTYTEPLGAGIGEASYQLSRNRQVQDKYTYNRDENGTELIDTALSNVFASPLLTQSYGLGYSFADSVWEIGLRAVAQTSTLDNRQTLPFQFEQERNFDALLPELNVEYQIRKDFSWRIRYRTSTELPSIGQLQNAIDNSNPVLLQTGNPLLRQAYTHSMFSRIVLNDPRQGNGVFAMLNFNYTEDYIGSSLLIASDDFPVEGLKPGQQLSFPENMQGAWSARAYASWGFAMAQGKLKANLRGGANVSENPSRINLQENFARTLSPEASFNLSSNLNEYIDFNFNTRVSYSTIENSLNVAADNAFTNLTQYAKVRYQTRFGLVLETDVNYQAYFGLSDAFDDNYVLWNAGLGYKFLKNKQLEAKIRFFDLLGQNASISRTQTATYSEDRSQLILEPYTMIGLTWKFGKSGRKPEGGTRGMPGSGSPHGAPPR